MNKLFLGSVALAAMIAGPAMAADMPVKAPPVVIYDWSGAYVGVDFGWGRSRYDAQFFVPGLPTFPFTRSSDQWLVSGHIGGQVQWSWLVLGVEGGAAAFVGHQEAIACPSVIVGCAASAVVRGRLSEVWTAGGRLGVAFNQWMVYGTAGY